MTNDNRSALVLSVYLNTRGFAFIVFEGRLSPYDWGIREMRGVNRLANLTLHRRPILTPFRGGVCW
ncbi:hypothetical protein ACVIW2_000139 [Bradyrhizobium huanghuaihaiense]